MSLFLNAFCTQMNTSERGKLLLMTTKLKSTFSRKIHFLAIYYLSLFTNVFYSLDLTIMGLFMTFWNLSKQCIS